MFVLCYCFVCVCVCGTMADDETAVGIGLGIGGGRDADKGCVMNQGGNGLCHGLPFCSTMPRLFLVSCAT